MKKFKKLAALVMAIVMVLSLSVTAYAEGEGGETEDPTTTGPSTPVAVTGPFTVTINNTKGHEYVIYQIFTGELSTKQNAEGKTEEVLSNIKYGADYVPTGKKAGDVVPENDLKNFNPNSITPTGAGTQLNAEGKDDTVVISNLVAGYYMIKDVTAADKLPDGEAPSAIIFQVVGNTTITSKHPETSIVKKVQDINDSTGNYTTAGEDTKDPENEATWIDSADYDIGDTVPFKSTATFDGLNNYETYKVIFTDIMAKGLTYTPNSMNVYVNTENKTGSFTINTADNTETTGDYVGGTVITVSCDDITALLAEGADSATIVLEYTATLNSNANLGAPGNPNKIKVTTKFDGTGETPWDVNIVFTYKLEANKFADKVEEGNELPGAGFTLYKWVITETEGENGTSSATADWVKIGNEITGAELTKFEWKGIDDGKYKLVETTTPTGYNTIDPIEFEVVAAHVIVDDNPTLTSLTGTAKTGEITFTAKEQNSTLSTDVVNKSGTVLPETGGIGTTIFYALGGVMVLAAIVLLITKKRMTSAE